jgi:hypothetical protein
LISEYSTTSVPKSLQYYMRPFPKISPTLLDGRKELNQISGCAQGLRPAARAAAADPCL